MHETKRPLTLLTGFAVFLSCSAFGAAQDEPSGVKRKQEISDSIRKFDARPSPYKPWLQQDVAWIITDEERAAFKLLKTDEERDNFIDAFWARRDPTPESFENEYKEEHYRRIGYANDRFSTTIPGWKTDRGRMYIMFGPPDETESYSSRSEDKTPAANPALYPLEVWHYRYIKGVGQDVALEFVDACRCGNYKMPMTPAREKDINVSVPGSLFEMQFSTLEPDDPHQYLGDFRRLKFKNLEEKVNVNGQLKIRTLPFEVTTLTTKVTDFSSLIPITISVRKRDIAFLDKKGSQLATLHIFERVMSPTGHVAEVFEGTLHVDSRDSKSSLQTETATFSNTLALRSSKYRIDIAVQDANSDHWATWSGIVAPDK